MSKLAVTLMLALTLSTVALVLMGAGAATAANPFGLDQWRSTEGKYGRDYPRFMRVARRTAPYRQSFLRLVYFAGGVGAFYGSGGKGDPKLCAAARRNPAAFRKSTRSSFYRTPRDFTLTREKGLTQFKVIEAYRKGALLGCELVVSPGRYVDRASSSCSDTGPGTTSRPFCTISKAAEAAIAGDVVHVAAGTYKEKVTVPRSGTSRAPIVFKAAPGAAVTVRGEDHGFDISGRSYITVHGFNVTDTSSYGIKVADSSFVTLSSNHVSSAGTPASGQAKAAIYLQKVASSVVSGNTVDHNSSFGIYLVDSSRNEIARNVVFNNAQEHQRAASGIRLFGSTDNTISSNVSHHNEDSGIELYAGSHNNLIVNNAVFLNGDHGIDVLQSKTNRVVSNTVYDNVTAGINVEGGSTGATIRNNIAINDGIDSPRTHSNIRVDAASAPDTTMDRDLVYLSAPGVMISWGRTNFTSLAAFRAATGQEANGVQADPRFANPAAGDFQPQSGSPAIDSADSGVNGHLSTDLNGKRRVDDPGTANTGVGPRAYDDRGAHEFVAP